MLGSWLAHISCLFNLVWDIALVEKSHIPDHIKEHEMCWSFFGISVASVLCRFRCEILQDNRRNNLRFPTVWQLCKSRSLAGSPCALVVSLKAIRPSQAISRVGNHRCIAPYRGNHTKAAQASKGAGSRPNTCCNEAEQGTQQDQLGDQKCNHSMSLRHHSSTHKNHESHMSYGFSTNGNHHLCTHIISKEGRIILTKIILAKPQYQP